MSQSERHQRGWEIFLEVFEALPRQGPGNRASAARALALCQDLPPQPRVFDLGCGVGAQTLHLADLTSATILAMDSHAPAIGLLRRTVLELGLDDRIRPIVGDMAHPPLAAATFDLIWSEGALYNIGIPKALDLCRPLLRPGACLAFTEAVWRKDNPPPEVTALFEEYPAMGHVSDVLNIIQDRGLELLGHFTLPDEAWWDDFYTPMLQRIAYLREKYSNDPVSLAALDEVAKEPEIHRHYSDYYAYEFFVVRATNHS